jgi:hypothetical protein
MLIEDGKLQRVLDFGAQKAPVLRFLCATLRSKLSTTLTAAYDLDHMVSGCLCDYGRYKILAYNHKLSSHEKNSDCTGNEHCLRMWRQE